MDPRTWIRAGLIGAAIMVFLALVGLIGRFVELNLVGEQITFARLVLVLVPFLVGLTVTRPRVEAGEVRALAPRDTLVAGAIAGAVAGAAFGAIVVGAEAFGVAPIRSIFLNVTEDLVEFLTFGQSPIVGALILTVLFAVAGLLGAAYRVTPDPIRRPIRAAITTVLVMGFLQRIVPIMLDQLDIERDWLYSKTIGGLTWLGAAVLAVLAAVISVLWARYRTQGRALLASGDPIAGVPPFLLLLILLGLGALIAAPFVLGSVISQVLGSVLIYVLLGLGLNIVVGYAGLLDLGYVAFFATGAYLTALFTGANRVTSIGDLIAPAFVLHLNFYLAVPLVIVVTALVGVLIGAPVLRLRGDYLAIVTLGFGEIARVLVQSSWLQDYTGGPQGLRDVTDAAIGSVGFRDPQPFFYLVLVFCALAILVSHRLAGSRVVRAWNAMREDELAAEAMGVSTIKYKLLAFAMGAAVGCLSGTLFAVQIGSIAPASFTIIVSITALAVVILGGMGSIPGVVVGTMLLIGLPGLLDEFEEYRLLIYGAALILIMVLRPQGLIPNVRRMRELQEDEAAQDQWLKQEEEAPAVTVGGGGGS